MNIIDIQAILGSNEGVVFIDTLSVFVAHHPQDGPASSR
jgi:hypothetical protein